MKPIFISPSEQFQIVEILRKSLERVLSYDFPGNSDTILSEESIRIQGLIEKISMNSTPMKVSPQYNFSP